MRLGHVKNSVGGLLVALHVSAIFLCFLWLEDRMKQSDFRITILILCPVTAIYALAFVREVLRFMFVGSADKDDSRAVTLSFVLVSVLFTVVFSIGVIYSIYKFSIGTTMTPDDLKERLAWIETGLGGFMGLIVETLFGKLPPKADTPSG